MLLLLLACTGPVTPEDIDAIAWTGVFQPNTALVDEAPVEFEVFEQADGSWAGVQRYASEHAYLEYQLEGAIVDGLLRLTQVATTTEDLDEGRRTCSGVYVFGLGEGGLAGFYDSPPPTPGAIDCSGQVWLEADGIASEPVDTGW